MLPEELRSHSIFTALLGTENMIAIFFTGIGMIITVYVLHLNK